MGTTFTPGQLAQVTSVVNIGTATALPKVITKYDPKALLKALEGRGSVLAERFEMALEQAFDSMFVLTPKGAAAVTLVEKLDPDAFYRTRTGLYVWDDYRTRIVAKAKTSEGGATYNVERFDLTRDMVDEEIEGALPKNHLFDETQVCGLIAGLIAEQPNGEEGKLLNNGFANLFYTGSCVVRVRWLAGNRGWSVHAWRRGGRGWSAGGRVFSPATAA